MWGGNREEVEEGEDRFRSEGGSVHLEVVKVQQLAQQALFFSLPLPTSSSELRSREPTLVLMWRAKRSLRNPLHFASNLRCSCHL